MNSTRKKILFALVPAVLVAVLVCLGAGLGYAFATWRMRSDFRAVASTETLRGLLDKTDRKKFAQGYYDPRNAEAAMDDFSYSVPNVTTPFVGCGPEPGKHQNATINSLQFRSQKELTLPKPPQTFRIFITGGSTAFGAAAPSDDTTIGAYLNAILDKELSPVTKYKYEVFTMANPSWASTHERIMIENRLLDLEPDLVISFSGNNDVHWGGRGRNALWFRNAQDEFNWRVLAWAYRMFRLKPTADVVAPDSQPEPPALVAERLERNARLSAFALSLKKVPYVFCLQPTLAVTRKPLTKEEQENLTRLTTARSGPGSNYFPQCYAEIDSHLKGLKMANFTYLNLSDVFDSMPNAERIFLDSYHFGDKGNTLVARGLFDRLRTLLSNAGKPEQSRVGPRDERPRD